MTARICTAKRYIPVPRAMLEVRAVCSFNDRPATAYSRMPARRQIGSYLQALRANSGHVEANFNLGVLHHSVNNLQLAVAAYEKVCAEPYCCLRSDLVLPEMGLCLWRGAHLGHVTDRRVWEGVSQAVELDAQHVDALSNLGSARHKLQATPVSWNAARHGDSLRQWHA